MKKQLRVSDELVMSKIHYIRGRKVMLDADLAVIYNVKTKALKQAVGRNLDLFPENFMLRLTGKEHAILRSQFVTSRWGGSRYQAFAFTEHGVLQLANVLKSSRARRMSIRIIEVFVKMTELLQTHKEIMVKLTQLEKKLLLQDGRMNRYGREIRKIFLCLKELLDPPPAQHRRIGYRRPGEE